MMSFREQAGEIDITQEKGGGAKSKSVGARYLIGENLKVVWAEFSTLS
jgi:hypothetical protein